MFLAEYEQLIIVFFLTVLLLLIFRKAIFDFLDPLVWFLFFRIAVPITFFVVNYQKIGVIYSSVILVSIIMFLVGMKLPTSNIRFFKNLNRSTKISSNDHYKIFLILALFSSILTLVQYKSFPLFQDDPLSSKIDFYQNNKLTQGVNMVFGSFMITYSIIMKKLYPKSGVIMIFLIMSIFSSLLLSSKGAILTICTNYIVANYILKKKFGIEQKNIKTSLMLLGFGGAVIWAVGLVLVQYSDEIDLKLILFRFLNSGNEVFYYCFIENKITELTNMGYNSLTYFLNPFLAPLGFKTIEFGMGVAIHGLMTGDYSGWGVNHTIFIEGIVLFGLIGAPLFTFVMGLFVSIGRNYFIFNISKLSPIQLPIVCFLINNIYTVASDSLLFIRLFFVVCLFSTLSGVIVFVFGIFKKEVYLQNSEKYGINQYQNRHRF
jgi:oligosaccharide repeat unit polymerase